MRGEVNMKGLKKLLSLGLVLALAVGVVGCSSKSNATKLDQIKENGKLIVGLNPDYPPFEFPKVENGKDEVAGFDVELANKISKEIGVEVEIKKMGFDGLIGALNANKIDIILSGMSPTDERKKSVDFSKLYYVTKNAVIVREGDEGKVKTEDDLKKLNVGVQKGTIQEEYVRDTLKMESMKSLTNVPDLVLDLKNGKIDAIVVNETVGMINTKQYDGIKLATSGLGDNVEEGMAAAIKKDDNNKEYLELINKVIKDLKDSGEIDKMLEDATNLAAKGGN
jgi:ABC-type amino acid transport substrate-binding protein